MSIRIVLTVETTAGEVSDKSISRINLPNNATPEQITAALKMPIFSVEKKEKL